MSYDVRSLANFILDYCESRQRPITNIEINKITFFVFEEYLLQTGCRITEAKIEAWEFGPVFRELYHEFKSHGRDEIKTRARKYCFNQKAFIPAQDEISPVDAEMVLKTVDNLLHLSASQMVHLSHVPGGPWDIVYNHDSELNCGMEITESVILCCSDSHFTDRRSLNGHSAPPSSSQRGKVSAVKRH